MKLLEEPNDKTISREIHIMTELEDWQSELLDRLRRIETKFTRWLTANGGEVETQKPVWRAPGMVEVPSMHSPLNEVLAAIPRDWAGGVVQVVFRGDAVAHVAKASQNL